MGHLRLLGLRIFLCPGYFVQAAIFAQRIGRFADGLSIHIRRPCAALQICIRVALIAFQPVCLRVDELQREIGAFFGMFLHIGIIFLCLCIIIRYRQLLIHRRLGDGQLHVYRALIGRFVRILPRAVRILNGKSVEKYRRPADNHRVVCLGGKALDPLLCHRVLKGFRPVQRIAGVNGNLEALSEGSGIAAAEGRIVTAGMGQLIVLRQHILCFVVAGIAHIRKIRRCLQDSLHIRIRIGILGAQIFRYHAVGVLVNGRQTADNTVFGHGNVFLIHCTGVALCCAVGILRILIPGTGQVAAQHIVFILSIMLQAQVENHLLPSGLVVIKITNGNGNEIPVRDLLCISFSIDITPTGFKPPAGLLSASRCTEIGRRIFLLRHLPADIIHGSVDKDDLLRLFAIDGHRLHRQRLLHVIFGKVRAITVKGPSVGCFASIMKAILEAGRFAAVPRIGQLGHVQLHIPFSNHCDAPGIAVLDAVGAEKARQKQILIAVSVQIAAGQRSRHGNIEAAIVRIAEGERLVCRFLYDTLLTALFSVGDLHHRLIIALGTAAIPLMAVGKHSDIIRAILVKISRNHGDPQLIGQIVILIAAVIFLVRHIIVHQKRGSVSFFLQLLSVACAGIIGVFQRMAAYLMAAVIRFRKINDDAVPAVPVEISGRYLEKIPGQEGIHTAVHHAGQISDILFISHKNAKCPVKNLLRRGAVFRIIDGQDCLLCRCERNHRHIILSP